ncbi:MAG: response regulator, partial [Acidobacteriota bacterium]
MDRTKGHLGRVLVVDDDPAIQRVCARVLRAEGWDVAIADDGNAAVDALATAKQPFDCVLSDVHMPGLD